MGVGQERWSSPQSVSRETSHHWPVVIAAFKFAVDNSVLN